MLLMLRRFVLLAASVSALIPREKLVSTNSIQLASLGISPDGKTVGFIAPDERKIKNVFIWNIAEGQKKQVTFEESNVAAFFWTGVQDVIIFGRDNRGDENFMAYKKNISEGAPANESTVISNKTGVTARLIANDKRHGTVLVGLNDANPSYHNVYSFDLITNQLSLVFSNSRFAAEKIYVDNDMRIRIASEEKDDGSVAYYRVSDSANFSHISSDADNWQEMFRVSADDARITTFLGFDQSNENVYWIWGEDTDLGSLIIAPISDISRRIVLYHAASAEMTIDLHPEDRTILSISEYYHKAQRVVWDQSIASDLCFLQQGKVDSPQIMDRSRDTQTWLITYDTGSPSEIFAYDRKQKSLKRLFSTDPELEDYQTSKQIGFNFTASDGIRIQAYLSLPPKTLLKSSCEVSDVDKEFARQGMIPAHPQKTVVLVHGGPDYRDYFEYSNYVNFLTSRGYAVLQVNFRGSTGFGKNFTNAGNGEWSKKMHSDLIDAVEFAITKGIANRSDIAIMGLSYGGYATLVGLTFTPDTFACGIDIVGPSNLITMRQSIPPYWKAMRQQLLKKTGGDPDTEQGRRALKERSPLFIADRVKKPLLIMQGANDPRVKQQESEQFVDALANHSIPFTYVLYPDEGHGFERLPNQLAMFGYMDKFLHDCLGGEYQPFTRGEYNESAIMRSENFTSAV